jgi:hypothetical protein
MVGKLKEKNWHFGISAVGKLYPFHVLMVSTRIIFTQDGINPIESKSIQHSSRRRQGKNWWNDKWREKLLAFIRFISDNDNSFYLEMGSEEKVEISNEPLKFIGKVSYVAPSENTLEEESELADFNYYEEDTEELYEVEDIE